MLDWKIAGGLIFDGSGSSALRADVGICGDRIFVIGDLTDCEAKNTVDASECMVCPGFIDAHSHSDTYLLIEPLAQSKIYQGITTEIVGNCGVSAAPLFSCARLPSDWEDKRYPDSWKSVADYINLLERVRPAPNVVVLVGHGKLRGCIMGYEARAATSDELRAMASLLERSMEAGGQGLSTGLIYTPGMYAAKRELEFLARIVSRHDGIYTTHMRNEGRYLLAAVEEAISIGRKTGVRVEISHLKTSGQANWPLIDSALALIEKARDQGISIAADRYPYTMSSTDLDVIFPDWAVEGGRDAILQRLRNPVQKARLRQQLLEERSSDYWGSVVIGSTNHPDNARFQGVPLIEVAEILNMDPVDAVLMLTDTDELQTGAFFSGMSEENMWKILSKPYVMIGTDASLRALTGPLSHDYPHPRAYGTVPRFLRAALDGKTVPLAEAIRKMTSLPAEQFKLSRRGRIAKGMTADIVVFNPSSIGDMSTYAEPHQLSRGIEFVMVNGEATLNSDGLTGLHAGRVLR